MTNPRQSCDPLDASISDGVTSRGCWGTFRIMRQYLPGDGLTIVQASAALSANCNGMSTKQLSLDFFDAYRRQDIDAMKALFHADATIRYVPFAMEGSLDAAGVAAWSGLIDAFPDLTNRVEEVWDAGSAAFARVFISGTQSKDAFGVPNQGRKYDLEHLFVIESDGNRITRMTSYWDSADWFRRLGRTSLETEGT